MIENFYKAGTLNSASGFGVSLLIGVIFGLALERAGFGSSRRLAGIFYFRDMTVLKVMFTAVVFAMLGLCYARAYGWVTFENVYFLNTLYVAQIMGGLIFGIGFVMSGWCPGTGAVGLASGRIDALVFLLGGVGGSLLYNELYPVLKTVFSQDQGILFAYDTLGVTQAGFAFWFTVIAVACFWGSEWIEKKRYPKRKSKGLAFLAVLSLVLITGALGLFALDPHETKPVVHTAAPPSVEKKVDAVSPAPAFVEPEDLADRLLGGDTGMVLVDIRPVQAFEAFHIRSARNLLPEDLPKALSPYRNQGNIILYSAHTSPAARARDVLFRMGFQNVSVLAGGLKAFVNTCLKPVSLRSEPVSPEKAAKINAWRAFFLTSDGPGV